MVGFSLVAEMLLTRRYVLLVPNTDANATVSVVYDMFLVSGGGCY